MHPDNDPRFIAAHDAIREADYGEPAFIFDGAENIRVTIEPLGDENPQPLQVQQP